jgi:hypothetical protein
MRAATYSLLFFVILLFVSSSNAQPLTTVYASETDGKDIPPCGAVTKPCKTFEFSLGQVAAKGRIIALNSGEYGPVRITKSVTIQGAPGADAMIEKTMTTSFAGTFSIEIAAGPDDNVTLRGLRVMSPGLGARAIVFSSAAALYVENCVVHGGLENIDIFPFGFTGDVRVYIRDTTVSGYSSTSISFTDAGIRVLRNTANSVRAEIERTSMEGNGEGLVVGDGASVSARGCVMARNRFAGVQVGGVTSGVPLRHTDVTLENDVISGNRDGLDAVNADVTVRVSNCTITDNDLGISPFLTPSVQYLSRRNNTLEANTVNGTFTGVYIAQ